MKLLIVLALFVASSEALIRCMPNVCQTVRCQAVTACNGRFVQGGGFCGCCDACVAQIGEGESCAGLLLLGAPLTSECEPGTQCDPNTLRCSKVTVNAVSPAPCQQEMDKYLASQQNAVPLLGARKPVCDSNGYYAPKQCSGSQCYCVMKDGQRISGYTANIWESSAQTCQCARDQAEYMASGLIGKFFYCTPDGSYQQVAAVNAESPVAPCQQELDKYLAAQQNSAPLLGLRKPVCDSNGYYAPKQCSGSQCYCVMKDGHRIRDYTANIWESSEQTCQCARDQAEYMATGLIGKFFYCTSDGSYQKYRCFGSVCFCADSNGNQVGTSSVPIGQLDSLNC